MGILGWILLGLLAGLIARALFPGGVGFGLVLTTLLGIAGALLGGFLVTALGYGDPVDGFFDASTWAASIGGALVILALWRTLADRR